MGHYFFSYSQVLDEKGGLLAIACTASSPGGGPSIRKSFLGQAGEISLPGSAQHSVWRDLPVEARFGDLASLEQAFAKWLPRELPNRHAHRLGLMASNQNQIASMVPVPKGIIAFWEVWYQTWAQPDRCQPKLVSKSMQPDDRWQLERLHPALWLPAEACLAACVDYYVRSRGGFPFG